MEQIKYLDRVAALTKTGSMYAVAKALGMSQDAISRYVHGTRYMDNYACLQVATALNIPLVEVIANIECQRARDTVKREAWAALAKNPTGGHAPYVKNKKR